MGNIYGYFRFREYDKAQPEYIACIRNTVKENARRYEDETGEQLEQLISVLRSKDTLWIDDLTSLGSNVSEIYQNWKKIAVDLHIYVHVLSHPAISCDKPSNRRNAALTADVLDDINVGIKLYRRSTQSEGIVRARKEGVQFGRPRQAVPADFEELCEKWKSGKLSLTEAAGAAGVSKSTFYHWTRVHGSSQ